MAEEGPVAVNERRSTWLASLLVLGAVGWLFATAPIGEFWWSDAPRHALNGAFLRDFARDLPLAHAEQYAIDYYVRYPALTILFYPPLFPAVEAVVFALVGVSPFAAQLTVALFYGAAGIGALFLARRWLPTWSACAAALLFVAAPELAFWGRQVMLELPACAFLLWCVHALLQYCDTGRTRWLAAAALLFELGLYTKLNVVFVAPVLVLALVVRRGWRELAARRVLVAAGAVVVAAVPLMLLTWKFGQANVQSVVGVKDAAASRATLEGWLWYLRRLPGQVGWGPCVAALAFLAASACWRGWRLPRGEQLVLLAWFLAGQLFLGSIDLKETRHGLVLLFPVALFAASLVARTLPSRFASPLALAAAAAVFGVTLARHPAPYVRGYAEAAAYVAQHAPQESAVLFSGYRDGSFVFHVRSHAERPDLAVVRADKLLLRVAVRRSLGVEERAITESQLKDQLRDLGVTYVVSQPGFWEDLANQRMLRHLLEGPDFELVLRIPVESNQNHEDREIRIYRNRNAVAAGPRNVELYLDMIGRRIEGNLDRGPAR